MILIAVALFAALSYAITQSGRGGGSVDKEQFETALSQTLQIMDMHHHGIQRMHILGGIEDNAYSFENTVWPNWVNNDHVNANCISVECEVFSPQGGQVNAVAPPAIMAKDPSGDLYFRFTGNIYGRGIGDIDTPDLMMGLLVTQETFVKINEKLGINNPSGAPPQIPGSALLFGGAFDGNYTADVRSINNTFPVELDGKMTGCFNQQHGFHSNDYAWFYTVLLAR